MSLARLELWSSFVSKGGARLAVAGFLPYRTAASTTRSLVNPDSFTYSIPGNSEGASVVRKGLVTRLWRSDSDFDEWPVGIVEHDRNGATSVDVTCRPITDLLTLCGTVEDPTAPSSDGIPVTAFGASGLTMTEAVNTYLIDNASVTDALPFAITLGTIDPTLAFDFDVDTVTPTALINAWLAAIAQMGVLAEFQLRRVSTTSYAIDIVTKIGASASTARIRVGKNLRSLKRTIDDSQRYSRITPKTEQLGGVNTVLGMARWLITNVSGSVLTLADPAGGAGPIGFDGQNVGLYVYVEDIGAYRQITASSFSAQTVTVASATSIAANMHVQFRRDGVGTLISYLDHPTYISSTPPGIGVVAGTIDRSTLQAVPNMVPNAGMRDWSDASKLPDGWTFVAPKFVGALGPGVNTPVTSYIAFSKNTDPLFKQVGSNSLHFSAFGGSIVTPPAKFAPWFAGMTVSVAWSLILTGGWDPTADPNSFLSANLGIVRSDGTIVQWLDAKRTISVQPAAARTNPPYGPLAGGSFDQLELVAQDITIPSTIASAFGPVTSGDISDLAGSALGIVALLTFTAQGTVVFGGGTTFHAIEGYLDAVSITPGSVLPDTISEFGFANQVYQSTNLALSLVAPPQPSYVIPVLDLPDAADAFTLGGPAEVTDTELGITFDGQRCVELTRDETLEHDLTVTLANKNKQLIDLLLQGSQSTAAKIASVAAASGGTSTTTGGSGGTTGTGLAAPVVSMSIDGSDVPTFIALAPPTAVKIKYAFSTSAQPSVTDARAGTEIDAPTDYTASDSALSPGDTEFVTVLAYDALGNESPPGFAHIVAPVLLLPGITDMVPIFVESVGGALHANYQYNWENDSLAYDATGGRNGGPAWRTRNFAGAGAYMRGGDGTLEGRVLCWVDLDSLTLDADGQLLVQLANFANSGAQHLAWGLDQNRHVLVYRCDAASDVLLETSTVQLPTSGKYLLELGFLIHPSSGYVMAKGYDISAGTPTAKVDLFDGTAQNTLSDNAGGIAEPIEIVDWGADAVTTTAFQVGGIDDILMGGFGFFEASGLGHAAFTGDVMALTAFAASDGHYADIGSLHWPHLNAEEASGLISFGRFEVTTQKNSFGVATFANVASVIAVAPMATTGKEHSGSAPNLRLGVRSGSTDADNGVDLQPNFSDWSSSQVEPGSLGYARGVFQTVDPATSSAWTTSSAQSAEIFIEQKGSNRLLVTQLGASVIYRPAPGTDGQVGGSCGSRTVPVTPLEWLDLGSINTSGQAVHAALHRTSTAATRGTGDLYSNSTGGADGGRAAIYNHSYGGPSFGAAGNVDFLFGPASLAPYWLADFPPSFADGLTSSRFVDLAQRKIGAVWVNLTSATLSSDVELFAFFDSSGVKAVSVFLTTARKIRVDNVSSGGPYNLVAATSTALSASGLNQVEVELVLDATRGVVNVWRVDATSSGARTLIGSTSAANTKHNNAKFVGGIEYGMALGSANGDGIIISDAVAASCGTGATGTGIGGCRSATLFPNAIGLENDSGGPYTNVTDDNGSGGTPDGDYNVLTTAPAADTYKTTAVPGDCATVLGAIAHAYVSRAFGGSGSDTGRVCAIVGGGQLRGEPVTVNASWPDGIGASHTGLNIDGPLKFTLNPGTGAALVPSDFSGTNAQVGWLAASHLNDQWIRQVTLSVLYAWTH